MHRYAAAIVRVVLALAPNLHAVAAVMGPADLVVVDAKIYTATADHGLAEALAVRDGKLVFVGSKSAAAEWSVGSTSA